MKINSKKQVFIITKETLEEVLDALSDHWFSEDGEHNNNDIIDAERVLKAEIESQITKETK